MTFRDGLVLLAYPVPVICLYFVQSPAKYVPLGLATPLLILIGVSGSIAIQPLLGDAKNAALAEDFAGAVIILGIFALLTLWFRRWQSGSLY